MAGSPLLHCNLKVGAHPTNASLYRTLIYLLQDHLKARHQQRCDDPAAHQPATNDRHCLQLAGFQAHVGDAFYALCLALGEEAVEQGFMRVQLSAFCKAFSLLRMCKRVWVIIGEYWILLW